MSFNKKTFLESVENNVDKVGSKRAIKPYNKKLFKVIATILDLEDQHRKKGRQINKELQTIINDLGSFLQKNSK